MARSCTAARKDGRPCTAPMMRADATRCFAHDEALQGRRAEARARGGRRKATAARHSKIMPVRLLPVWDQLERALADVLAGDLDPKQAQAAASVARALAAILTAGEVEERLRRLEEATAS